MDAVETENIIIFSKVLLKSLLAIIALAKGRRCYLDYVHWFLALGLYTSGNILEPLLPERNKGRGWSIMAGIVVPKSLWTSWRMILVLGLREVSVWQCQGAMEVFLKSCYTRRLSINVVWHLVLDWQPFCVTSCTAQIVTSIHHTVEEHDPVTYSQISEWRKYLIQDVVE